MLMPCTFWTLGLLAISETIPVWEAASPSSKNVDFIVAQTVIQHHFMTHPLFIRSLPLLPSQCLYTFNQRNLRTMWSPSHPPTSLPPSFSTFTATAFPTSMATVIRTPEWSVTDTRRRPWGPSKARLPLTSCLPSKLVLGDSAHGANESCGWVLWAKGEGKLEEFSGWMRDPIPCYKVTMSNYSSFITITSGHIHVTSLYLQNLL